jgi:N-acetylmuramoyl-L-alanine amidase
MPRTGVWSLLAAALVTAAACAPAPGSTAVAPPAGTPTPSVLPTVPSARAAAPAASPPSASPPASPAASLPVSPSARPSRPASRSARVRVVVLDPGHDGGNAARPDVINRQVPAGNGTTKPCNTVGASTVGGYPEHAFTWDVTRRTRALLAARGVRVVLTRANDTGVGPCVDVRGRFGAQVRADAVVSVHADGAAPGGSGFHVITASGAPGGASVAAASLRLATAVHTSLQARSGLRVASYVARGDGYDVRSDLAGLTLSTRPTLVVEAGNMRNAGDAALQQSAAGRQRIAAALAAGILAYLR